jgi:UTP--glucose-1-phosphate uridylyltransferase
MTATDTLRAIIPIAGLGTRMRPWTLAAPKALLPLVDAHGCIRPAIHWILAETAAADVARVALVAGPTQAPTIETYLDALTPDVRRELPERIEFIIQNKPAGFGEAVLRTRDFAAGRDILIMLGDHVHLAEASAPPVTRQLRDAWDACDGKALIGVQAVDESELPRVGTCAGEPLDETGLYRCRAFREKPDPAVARRELRTPGLPENQYLAHNGCYLFDPAIYDCLADLAEQKAGGEVELAAAQSMLLARHPEDYRLLRPAADACDIGTPEGYVETFTRFSRFNPR